MARENLNGFLGARLKHALRFKQRIHGLIGADPARSVKRLVAFENILDRRQFRRNRGRGGFNRRRGLCLAFLADKAPVRVALRAFLGFGGYFRRGFRFRRVAARMFVPCRRDGRAKVIGSRCFRRCGFRRDSLDGFAHSYTFVPDHSGSLRLSSGGAW